MEILRTRARVPVPSQRHRDLVPYQIELVVHVITRARFSGRRRQVAIDQVGRYWIFFSLRLMMRTRSAWSAAAKSGQETGDTR